MGHAYNEHDLEQALRRTAPGGPPRPDFVKWCEKHPEALRMGKGNVGARADYGRALGSVLRFGRNIMKTRKRRFGLAAAAVVAVAVAFIAPGTNKAWSVEQTIAAMKKIEILHISGQNLCGGKLVPFDCWVRIPPEGSDVLRLRYQCGCERRTTVVVRGGTVYAYWPLGNVVRIMDGSKLEDLQYWYEGAKISPWLTGKLLETLRLIGRGWQQTVETDPNTGQEQIIVTCNHPPSNVSALLVVDPQSKLVRQAKLWRNLHRAGEPEFDARTIVYNPEVPQGFFEFQVPPGATVISQEDGEATQALFEQAEQLFKDKKYAEAIGYYQRVHDRYPLIGWGSTSLMMVGICYTHLGDNAKAIECYQQALHEFPTGWEGVIQFYLGAAYLDNGQTQEALAAFEACLADAEGKRAPDQFPVKEARAGIARIKGQ
jgi:hypothetical protein